MRSVRQWVWFQKRYGSASFALESGTSPSSPRAMSQFCRRTTAFHHPGILGFFARPLPLDQQTRETVGFNAAKLRGPPPLPAARVVADAFYLRRRTPLLGGFRLL